MLEDPSVAVRVDRFTGQQLIGGMGELHLEASALPSQPTDCNRCLRSVCLQSGTSRSPWAQCVLRTERCFGGQLPEIADMMYCRAHIRAHMNRSMHNSETHTAVSKALVSLGTVPHCFKYNPFIGVATF
eukprot:1426744-Pleurochrysis_carterae.AAC.4